MDNLALYWVICSLSIFLPSACLNVMPLRNTTVKTDEIAFYKQ